MRTLYLKNVATLALDKKKCNGCGMCLAVCPHDVFDIRGKKAVIICKDACMECGACVKNCAPGALTVQSGVGCAGAVINGFFTGKEECDCGGNDSKECC